MIAFPLLGALIILFFPSNWKMEARLTAFLFALATLFLAVVVYFRITGSAEYEFSEITPWIATLGISWYLGANATVALLLIMTPLLLSLGILSCWFKLDKDVKAFHASLLVLMSLFAAVFTSLDLFVFCAAMGPLLALVWFLASNWGKDSAARFAVFAASSWFLILVGSLYAGFQSGSFDLLTIYAHKFTLYEQIFLFILFAVAFGILTPIIGLHSWLVSSMSDTFAIVAVILTLLVKVGLLGFLKIAVPAFPLGLTASANYIFIIVLAGVVLSPIFAFGRRNLREFAAYIVMFHSNIVLLGLFALEPKAATGACFHLFTSGIAIAGLIFTIDMIEKRLGTINFDKISSLVRVVPIISAVFVIVAITLIGMPGLGTFVSEFLLFLGSFQTQTVYTLIGMAGLLLLAAAFLRILYRMLFDKLDETDWPHVADLNSREFIIAAPLIVLFFTTGLVPHGILSKIEQSAGAFVQLGKRVEMIIPGRTEQGEEVPPPL